MNPLVPNFVDGFLMFAAIAATIFTLASIVSWFRSVRALRLAQFGWLAAILLVPILGPAAWFVFGRASQLAASRVDRVGVTAN